MLFTGQQAVKRAQSILHQESSRFTETNVHLIANFDTAVRRTTRDGGAVIAARAETEAKVNIAMLRLQELGVSCCLYLSDADFLAGIATCEINWSKPIQLVYSGSKYSAIDGIRCLTPILSELRSLTYTNSGVMGRALGWNKFVSTRVLQAAAIPTPVSWLFRKDRGWKGDEKPVSGVDVIIKNNTEAWGLGVSDDPVLRTPSTVQVEQACHQILSESGLREVIVQEYVDGPEIYTPVFQSGPDFLVFEPVEIKIDDREWSTGEPIGLELNRRQRHTFHMLNDPILSEKLAELASKAMDELEIEIVSRMDFRIDKNGIPKLFDMAEVPGLSDNHAIGVSLSSAQASFDAWELMIALNIERAMKNQY